MPQKRRLRGPYKPLLSEKLILAWAEVYYRRHGFWPFEKAGPVEGTETETWAGVSFALYKGTRGLKRRTTLAKLLCEKRKVYSRRPALTLMSAIQGSRGLDLARDHRPQVIVLDLHLPDLDGVEVLARLRGDTLTRDIPVVVLSADATPGQVTRLLAQGATAYLTKPLDVHEFLALLDRLCEGTVLHA